MANAGIISEQGDVHEVVEVALSSSQNAGSEQDQSAFFFPVIIVRF